MASYYKVTTDHRLEIKDKNKSFTRLRSSIFGTRRDSDKWCENAASDITSLELNVSHKTGWRSVLFSRLQKESPAGQRCFTGLILLGITVSTWCLIRGSFLTCWKGVDVEMTVMNYLHVLWPRVVHSHFHNLISSFFNLYLFWQDAGGGGWFQVTLINTKSSLGRLAPWHF